MKHRRRQSWRSHGLGLSVTFGLALAAWGGMHTGAGRRLEGMSEDWRLQLRARLAPRAPHEALTLVEIDETSLRTFGRWPFPRVLHGYLMEWLGRDARTRPAVLGWDLLFVETSAGFGGGENLDEAMAAPLAALPYPVVAGAASDPNAPGLMVEGRPGLGPPPLARAVGELAGLPDEGGALLPFAALGEHARTAFLDAHSDADGVVRRIPLVVRVGDAVYPGLALECLLSYWKIDYGSVDIRPGDAVRVAGVPGLGEARIPIDARGCYRINYRHERLSDNAGGGFARVSYAELYTSLAAVEAGVENTPRPRTAGKILIVGQVATGLTDLGPSPLAGQSPKVLVHLNAMDNILRGDHLRGLAPGWMLLAALGLGLGLARVLDRRGYGWHALATPLAFAGLVGGSVALLVGANVMTPLALPVAALALQQGALLTLKIREERAHRERVKGMFGAYVSPALVKRMVDTGEEPRLGGVEEEITAYFSDIENFSGFSEHLSPTQLVELMNEYLTACTDVVQAEGATLDKYIGDAVVAMYGAPLALPQHARCAVVSALRVQKRCAELRAKWRNEPEKNWPEIVRGLRTRVGLNTGRAVIGNMGSHTRFNYTMMGDDVNLAARMESGAKTYGVCVMLTAATREQCERDAPGAVLFRRLDRIVVKGRTRAVDIFEAVALASDLDASGEAGARTRECVRLFEQGLRGYQARDWDEAERLFRLSSPLEERPGHSPSDVLLERVAHLRREPPPADWDGVWRMTTK